MERSCGVVELVPNNSEVPFGSDVEHGWPGRGVFTHGVLCSSPVETSKVADVPAPDARTLSFWIVP